MNRDQKFGRLLAIANALSQKVFEDDKVKISEKHMSRFSKNPALALEKIHAELLEYAPKFGEDEMQLINLFGELLADMEESEFTNEPLNPSYLHGYYAEQNALNNIIGVEDAAELWGLKPGTIKNYCAEGKIKAKKIGKTWIIDKKQPNPRGGNKMKNDNWYVFVDAREDDNLSHDEAVQLLIEKGVSDEEIKEITDKYYKWTIESAFE